MLCDICMGGMAGELQEEGDIYTHTQRELIYFIVQQKVTQHYKAIILQFLKKN